MKKRLLLLIAFVGVFILWGCPNNVTPPEPDTLEPVKTEYNVGAEGGELSISFRTNLEYKVGTDASWLTASAVTKAVETKNAKVTVQPNPEAEPRTGHVTVEAGSLTTVITVVQSALKPEINITPSSGYNDIPAAGGSFSVDVSSNVSYEVSVSEMIVPRSLPYLSELYFLATLIAHSLASAPEFPRNIRL